MIRKKIIRVPIYQTKVTVLLVDSLKEIEDRYQLKDTECVAAMVFRRKYNYFVAFERVEPGSNCSSEIPETVCCCGHKEKDCSFKKNGKCQK